MIKTEASHLFLFYINFLCDFSFIHGAWWISFPPQVMPVWTNLGNSTIELLSSSQPEIRQGRVALYMKSGRGDMYSIYLMYFVNRVTFDWTKVLIQIIRKASRKSDIDKVVFIQNHSYGQKMLISSN